jgi:ABC-type Fe3+-siderophore transport system permease subunit
LAALLIEPVRWRRRLIVVTLGVGLALSVYLLVKMIGHPYAASAATGHIVYRNSAAYPPGIEIPYVVATTISLLLSSHRAVQLLAGVILGGFAFSYWSYYQSYISVWCFFAAVSSVLVYLFVSRRPHADRRWLRAQD